MQQEILKQPKKGERRNKRDCQTYCQREKQKTPTDRTYNLGNQELSNMYNATLASCKLSNQSSAQLTPVPNH
jgi:hypothetical protein